MSGAAQGNSNMQKHKDATVTDSKDGSQPLRPQKPAAQLEEDDEFEDFPIEAQDWAKEEEVGAQANNAHLWEESWDDDDTSDDFSVQLKEELKKMESRK
ncbi:26S proteasome complex subunit [Meristemomyces frigidus]|nr:26S proteasome complex subunit [Meristemomyces frigidus]